MDLLFTKEALCHIDDKASVFADYYRVLRPGGEFVGSDWMTGGEVTTASEAYRTWEEQLRSAGLTFIFKSIESHRQDLEAAGFEGGRGHRRHRLDHRARRRLCGPPELGPERPRMVKLLGEDGLAGLITRCQARVDALKNGDLRRCHMRAVKPEQP